MADKFQTQCPHCGVKFQISSQQLSLANGNVRCGSCLQVFQASSSLVPLTGGTAPSGVGSARAPSAAPSARPPAAAPTSAPVKPAAPPPQKVAPPPRAAPPPPPVPEESDDDLADMILRELENPEPAPPPPPRAARPAPQAPVPKAAPPAAPPRAPAPPPPRAPAAPPAVATSSIDDDNDDLADMILRELENPEPAPAPKTARPAVPQSPSPQQTPQWTPPQQSQRPPEPQWSAPAAAKPQGNRYGIEDNKTKVSLGKGQDENLIDDGDDDSRIQDSRTTNRIVSDDDIDIFGGGANTLLDNIDEPVDESWAKELLGEKVENEKDALVRRFTEIKADNLSLATTGVQEKSALQNRLARLERNEVEDTQQPLSRTGSMGSASSDLDTDPDDLDFLNDGGLTMQDVDIHPVDHNSTEFDTVGMAHQVEWGRETFWGALTAVFALVLLGQYLVFNFDTLSREDSWRGLYEVACGAIGCELPNESDINRIQGANLVVRSHPTAAGALVIDAIVYNRAPFAQPFPDLELSFSDRSGKLLAGRVFKPEEYLKGELAGSESMPSDTPVHLSLELVDPGTEAVNYQLRFLPPTTSS